MNPVRAARKFRGLTQKELARLTGTKQPGISAIERGGLTNHSTRILKKIADALNCRLTIVLTPKEKPRG